MQAEELKKYLNSLTNEILEVSAHIVAETATTYYKESFRRKGFDGRPWKPPKRPTSKGSLLVDSSALMNSIRPTVVTNERVVISAGNDKVTYAQAHNEGFVGSVNIPAHKRKSRAGKGRGKEKKASLHDVRAHKRMMRIPRRQFMGNSRELNDLIFERIKGYIAHNKK